MRYGFKLRFKVTSIFQDQQSGQFFFRFSILCLFKLTIILITFQNKSVKITDHKINLTLPKVEKAWWPRLTSQPQKPAWLKIDFDRWQSEDDLLDEEVRDIREDYPGIYEKLQKQEMGYITGR